MHKKFLSDCKPFTNVPVIASESTRPILLRLPAVQAIIPISRSTWYAGIKNGIYPAPIKISARASAWRLTDIQNLVERFKH
jgi:prophage regulatory protein